MIRLSVEQLHELQRSVQATGEVNATVLPKTAFSTDKLFVAWARSINQEEFYLAVWRNEDSWRAAASQSQGNTMDASEFEYQVKRVLTGGPEMITTYDTEEEAIAARRQGQRENE